MKDYPYIKCLSPRKIHNPYNHQDMIVPCGHCEACLLRKSATNVLKVQLETKEHLYCRFITLTYDNTSIPRMNHIINEEGDYELYDCEYGNYITTISNLDSFNYHSLLRKFESNYPPFLRKYDLQLFFKRLRKYFNTLSHKYNISYGKIRYFACGEYGPKHFRPHYHIILWTSCDNVISDIGKAVSSCWQLGRVSTEIPFTDVSRYVAQYVNSTCPLPKLLKLPETKPFSVHSLHLGETFFQATREEIYEAAYESIIRKCSFISNTYSDCFMWRSLKAYYFPRCKEYDIFSTSQRYEAYMALQRIYAKFPALCGEKLTYITDFLLRYFDKQFELYSYIPDSFLRDLASYCSADWWIKEYDSSYESVYRSLYMILRLSKHFIEFVCDGNTSYFHTHYMLTKIENFWKNDELFNLNRRYQCIQDSDIELFETEEEYTFLFTTDPEKITNTSIYKKFRSDRLNNYKNSMKHKEQNDLNRVFENY